MLNSVLNNPLVIVALLIAVFGIIGLSSWLIKKYVIDKKKKDSDTNEEKVEKTKEEIAQEDLNRVLEDVDDEELASKIKNYNEEDD